MFVLEFAKDSSEYKKKYESIKKVDNKSLRSICEILTLDRKGSKNEIASRVLKFLMEPDESLCIEQGEEEEEEVDDEDMDVDDDAASEDDKKRKSSKPSAGTGRGSARNSTGRPKRSTAGKKMSAYVDLSSSKESEHKVTVAKRRRNDDSESGSDYNPSGNSDSDAERVGGAGD